MRESMGDLRMLQRGLARPKPARSGMQLYTTRFERVSLCDLYRGQSCFLVLSGPSLRSLDLSLLAQRGVVTMAVNNAWSVVRPNLWCCVDNAARFLDAGWRDPAVMKFTPVANARAELRTLDEAGNVVRAKVTVADCPNVFLFRRNSAFDHARFLDCDAAMWGQDAGSKDSIGISGGRSVMLAALRLLHHLGFATVYLLGADFRMTAEDPYAFRENRAEQALRNNNGLYRTLDRRFAALRPHFEAKGFRVVNCTPESGLTAFERDDYAAAVERVASGFRRLGTEGWYEPRPAAVAGK